MLKFVSLVLAKSEMVIFNPARVMLLCQRMSYIDRDEVLQAGFIFHPYAPYIVCAECGWKTSGTLDLEHIKFMHKINNSECSLARSVDENYECYVVARECVLRTEEVIRNTFNKWPKFLPHVEKMVKSGLYYTGFQDDVQCICCQAIFCDWEETDDPILIHCAESPYCEIVKMLKTSKYFEK